MYGLGPPVLVIRVCSTMYKPLYLGFAHGRDSVHVYIFSRIIQVCASVHACTLSRNICACAYAIFRERDVRTHIYAILCACTSVIVLAPTSACLCVCTWASAIIRAQGSCYLCLYSVLSNRVPFATLNNFNINS